MRIPKWYLEAQARRIDRLERRIRRLELICLEDAKSKIASLRDEEAGTITKDGWPLIKLFNAHLATGNPEECDKIKVDYKKAFNSKL